MTDAVARAVARKAALDSARRALRSGSRSELESALRELPPDGRKSRALSKEIKTLLASASSEVTTKISSVGDRAICSSDGLKYEFRLGETGDISLFHPERIGAHVSVVINTAHPFGKELAENDRWRSPAVLTLLAAWANYELDQSDERRRHVVRETRIDWGRVVRRILASDTGFRVD